MKYDIAIIGGGPAGYTAAERAAAGYAAGKACVAARRKALLGLERQYEGSFAPPLCGGAMAASSTRAGRGGLGRRW